MEIRLIDTGFKQRAVIDSFISFVWTDRYYECGDFEIKMPANLIPDGLKVGAYLAFDRSEHTMIIETICIDRTEEGNIATISGRSLESVLDRRVVYNDICFKSDDTKGLEYYIKMLLNDNVISPSNPFRIIMQLSFEESGLDTSSIEFEAQHQGTVLYDTICSLCKNSGVGWKIEMRTQGNKGGWYFKLYTGKDHSLNAESGNKVLFSDDMGNLAETQYLESTVDFKNVALVTGEKNEETGIKTTTEVVGNTGDDMNVYLYRREMPVSCSSSRTTKNEAGETVELSEEDYKKVLQTAGFDELSKHRVTRTANGNAVAVGNQYEYGRDFSLGDFVTVNLGISGSITARVVETTFSMDADGFQQYQSFENVGIQNASENPSTEEIKIGSTVRVKNGATTYDGNSLASFVYGRPHIVSELVGDRAVITYEGVVVAAVEVSDLILV